MRGETTVSGTSDDGGVCADGTLFFKAEMEDRRVLAIDSGLPPEAFAKSGRAALITERGVIVAPDGTQSEWTVDGTFVRRGTVCFFGEDFDGGNLYDLLNGFPTASENDGRGQNEGGAHGEARKAEAWRALTECARTVLHSKAALEAAAKTGPAGVFRRTDGDGGNAILVFPPELFSRCVSSLPDDKAFALQGIWMHPAHRTIPPETAFSFACACAAYKIVSGRPPFGTEENFARRVSTRAFIKTQDVSWEIASATAEKINALLSGKTADGAVLRAHDAAVTLESFGADFHAVCDAEKTGRPEPEAFKARRAAMEKQIERKIKRDANIREHKNAALAAIAVLLAVPCAVLFFLNTAANRPDTAGLSPFEVTERFYQAVDTLDQTIPKAYSAKNTANKYIEENTDVYIQIKMRQALKMEHAAISPESFYAAAEIAAVTDNAQVYGLTKLEIAETAGDAERTEYSVSFFLWTPFFDGASGQQAGEETTTPPLTVYQCRENVTLVFTGKKWLVSRIETVERTALRLSRAEITANARAYARGEAELPFFAPNAEDIAAERRKLTGGAADGGRGDTTPAPAELSAFGTTTD